MRIDAAGAVFLYFVGVLLVKRGCLRNCPCLILRCPGRQVPVATERIRINAAGRPFCICCGRFASQGRMPSEMSLLGFAVLWGGGACVL